MADERYYSDGSRPHTSSRNVRSSRNVKLANGRDEEETGGWWLLVKTAGSGAGAARHVDSGFVPGAVAVLARHGEVHIEATVSLAFEGAGLGTPMAGDTICHLGSMTKPIVAACAMTLVEDPPLR
jgi:hypothetical protein